MNTGSFVNLTNLLLGREMGKLESLVCSQSINQIILFFVDPYPKSPEPPLLGAFSNQVLSNSHLGSALHNSVARSFSDSTKHGKELLL